MIKKIGASLVLIFSLTHLTEAQNLPTKIESYLNKNYKGWKISPTSKNCGGDGSNSIVSGDFDGDKKIDYAAKIVKGKQGFVIGFLAQTNDYKPFLLHSLTATETHNTALLLYRKGEKYYTEIGEENSAITLKTDAPYDTPCESDAGGIHIFRNGKFDAL